MKFNPCVRIGCWFGVLIVTLMQCLPSAGHSVWRQRNEPGDWTVVLYHCDEEDVSEGQWIENADRSHPELDLFVGPAAGEPLDRTVSKHGFLDMALVGLSAQECVASEPVEHPQGDMSIEMWFRFLVAETDVVVGFREGVSLHIRLGLEGDRLELLGANSSVLEENAYGAPGVTSLPSSTNWHHFGVTISAPNVTQEVNGNYRYGEGCIARFFYDSHVVGFVDQETISLEGLEFAAQAYPELFIQAGEFAIDEIMISNVDWSNPVGHGGTGHEGTPTEHAFEDGRQPTSLDSWMLH